jgi:hypothetical protein
MHAVCKDQEGNSDRDRQADVKSDRSAVPVVPRETNSAALKTKTLRENKHE